MAGLQFNGIPCQAQITGRFGDKGPDYPADGHRGVDFACPPNTALLSTLTVPAQAIAFGNDGSFGNGVCLDVPNTPYYVLYAHMQQALVQLGGMVQPGQLLGMSGATGHVTGPHCHVQISVDASFPPDISKCVDMLKFLRIDQNALYTFIRRLCTILSLNVTPGRVEFMQRWEAFEGTGAGVWYNPFATTWDADPTFHDVLNPYWNNILLPNGQTIHVTNYKDLESGAQATARTLRQDNFAIIVQALQQERVLPGLSSVLYSSWGTTGLAAALDAGYIPTGWQGTVPKATLEDVVQVLGGDALIADWKARGNQLLAPGGYPKMQNDIQDLYNRMYLLAQEPTGQARQVIIDALKAAIVAAGGTA